MLSDPSRSRSRRARPSNTRADQQRRRASLRYFHRQLLSGPPTQQHRRGRSRCVSGTPDGGRERQPGGFRVHPARRQREALRSPGRAGLRSRGQRLCAVHHPPVAGPGKRGTGGRDGRRLLDGPCARRTLLTVWPRAHHCGGDRRAQRPRRVQRSQGQRLRYRSEPVPRSQAGRSDRALPLAVFPAAGDVRDPRRHAEVQRLRFRHRLPHRLRLLAQGPERPRGLSRPIPFRARATSRADAISARGCTRTSPFRPISSRRNG